eukprot:1309306-Amphidinium_carterae.1
MAPTYSKGKEQKCHRNTAQMFHLTVSHVCSSMAAGCSPQLRGHGWGNLGKCACEVEEAFRQMVRQARGSKELSTSPLPLDNAAS